MLQVFFDVSVGGRPAGRMVIGLFGNVRCQRPQPILLHSVRRELGLQGRTQLQTSSSGILLLVLRLLIFWGLCKLKAYQATSMPAVVGRQQLQQVHASSSCSPY